MAGDNSDFYCNPITGNLYRKICGMTRGGLVGEIFAANLSEIETITVVDKVVTAITMKTNPVTLVPYHWFRIVAKKETSGINNIAQIGTNSKFVNQELDFATVGMDTESKKSFESLINGQAVFIGCDANSLRHMMGRIGGAEMTEGAIGTGIAFDDLTGTTAKFVAQETEVTPSVQTGIVIDVLAKDGVTIEQVTL